MALFHLVSDMHTSYCLIFKLLITTIKSTIKATQKKKIKVIVTSMSKIANTDGYWTWKYQCSFLQHPSTWLELSRLMLDSQWRMEDFLQEEKEVKWGKGECMALQDSLPGLSRLIPIKHHFPTPPKPGYQHRTGSVWAKSFASRKHHLQRAATTTVFRGGFLSNMPRSPQRDLELSVALLKFGIALFLLIHSCLAVQFRIAATKIKACLDNIFFWSDIILLTWLRSWKFSSSLKTLFFFFSDTQM